VEIAHHDGEANLIEVYAGYPRRTIDQAFGRTATQAVRRAGHLLASDGRMTPRAGS
jgi:hypothetical protein